jgi:hypothetical protein
MDTDGHGLPQRRVRGLAARRRDAGVRASETGCAQASVEICLACAQPFSPAIPRFARRGLPSHPPLQLRVSPGPS